MKADGSKTAWQERDILAYREQGSCKKFHNSQFTCEFTVKGSIVFTFVAEPDTYGADKLWVLLKGIPIELDKDEEDADGD